MRSRSVQVLSRSKRFEQDGPRGVCVCVSVCVCIRCAREQSEKSKIKREREGARSSALRTQLRYVYYFGAQADEIGLGRELRCFFFENNFEKRKRIDPRVAPPRETKI